MSPCHDVNESQNASMKFLLRSGEPKLFIMTAIMSTLVLLRIQIFFGMCLGIAMHVKFDKEILHLTLFRTFMCKR